MLPSRQKVYEIIFGTDTPAGRNFDIFLITAILISVGAVLLESVPAVSARYRPVLVNIEWFFTILFTIEYLVRIWCSPKPLRYATGFFGIVDLLSILPTYIGLFYPDLSYLLIIRLLRVLRIFRVLKLVRYLSEANILMRALLSSRRKVLVFFSSVLVMTTVIGSLMFVIEGPENGFTSIPISVYWCIVTITTVGYGDITPHTVAGQILASFTMLLGYSIIAVPTGILTAELAQEIQRERGTYRCGECGRGGHERDSLFCKHCGSGITPPGA